MMKFLVESTDTPHVSGLKSEKLPLPNPGVDEYRKYWDERMVSRMQTVAEGADEAQSYVEGSEGTQMQATGSDGTQMQAESSASSKGVAIHEVEVSELTARFVAASCEHEPTDEEWRACLLGAGYTEEKVSLILSGANAEG